MEILRRVLLYGKSVILGTLEASLKRYTVDRHGSCLLERKEARR